MYLIKKTGRVHTSHSGNKKAAQKLNGFNML